MKPLLEIGVGTFFGFLYFGGLLFFLKRWIGSKFLVWVMLCSYFVRILIAFGLVYLLSRYGSWNTILLFLVGFAFAAVVSITFQKIKEMQRNGTESR